MRRLSTGFSFLLLLALAAAPARPAQDYQPNWESLDQRPMPAWFADAKFGIFIHWGVYSVPSYAPVLPGKLAYSEWYWHQMTEGRDNPKANGVETGTWAYHQRQFGASYDYAQFAPQFRAELFDPDHWASVFADSGARYVVLTSKHHEGFALWPSHEASASWGRPWNAVEQGPHRDLLGDLTDAVRRKGLRMGYYYSIYEWYNPLYRSDPQAFVERNFIPQFKDLVTRYKPSLIFSDGEWEHPSSFWRSPEVLAWLFNESAVKDEVVVNDRWGSDTRHKHGGYWTTEYTPGMGGGAHAWEENRGMGYSFGYNRAEQLGDYRTGRQLVLMLADIVSRGGNLLLDIGPAADGTIPVIMQDRLHQLGDWLKVNGEAIYGTRAWRVSRQWSPGEQPKVAYDSEFETPYDVAALAELPAPGKAAIEAFFTTKGNAVYAILPHWPGRTFAVHGIERPRSARLLGAPGALRLRRTADGVTIELPPLPEGLMHQPAWVIELDR